MDPRAIRRDSTRESARWKNPAFQLEFSSETSTSLTSAAYRVSINKLPFIRQRQSEQHERISFVSRLGASVNRVRLSTDCGSLSRSLYPESSVNIYLAAGQKRNGIHYSRNRNRRTECQRTVATSALLACLDNPILPFPSPFDSAKTRAFVIFLSTCRARFLPDGFRDCRCSRTRKQLDPDLSLSLDFPARFVARLEYAPFRSVASYGQPNAPNICVACTARK